MKYVMLLLFYCVMCIPYVVKSRASFGELQVRSLYPRDPNSSFPNKNSCHPNLSCDPCHYEIAIISDDDEKSKSKNHMNIWESKFVKTTLDLKVSGNNFTITLGKMNETILSSNISDKEGLGMELSELIYYNGHLLTFDDKTGTIYKIVSNRVDPWLTLEGCKGSMKYGYKSEWAAVKDKKLYVGSAGFPWSPSSVNDTEPRNCGPQWIKLVSENGAVQNINWKPMFNKIQDATMCKGYVTHESVMWSDIQKKWFFAPRKCSTDAFNSTTDNMKGTNLLISANESFDKIEVVEIGQAVPSRGFSSFKFLPHSDNNIIVALKSYEDNTSFKTYLTVFCTNGIVYLDDTLISI